MAEEVLTVGQLTDLIKADLEEKFPAVWVTGEISNYLHHSSGHRYFTLKDNDARIKCVLWKFTGRYLSFEPENGMKVRIFGDITVYPRGGNYQLRVNRILPVGIGDLEAEFQRLKEQLYREGLFDDEHKQPLPDFPSRIGIVTSPTGAAIRDMINILRRRAPAVEIIIAPVHVQGEGAAEEIARAIRRFNRYGGVDLIITGRGGGSLEDLWAFNEEVVARAIFESELPVVSAVGHQVDFTISDFVADLRAPTPSAAAELAVPDVVEIQLGLKKYRSKLSRAVLAYIELARQRLSGLKRSPVFRRPLEFVYRRQQELDDLRLQLIKQSGSFLRERRNELTNLTDRLIALSPEGVLRRGFAVVRKADDSLILRDSQQVVAEESVNIKLYRGSLKANVSEVISESD